MKISLSVQPWINNEGSKQKDYQYCKLEVVVVVDDQ